MVEREIKLLDEETIGKISAGEVIEQPASIVKELVENSIDAGASSISVEIKEGGISYIRVTDDGCGISKDQIRNAFLRHSTSKINNADDLYYVHTLGFRGEALASIAAVSKVRLLTKSADDPLGTTVYIEGGLEKEFEDCGTPDGTTFIITDIFYNTPVRKKFLLTSASEGNQIQNLVEHIAFSHPDISFRFISNGSEKILTPGNGNLKDTVYKILGNEIVKNILPIEAGNENVKISGYIGKSVINRGNRKYETFFVNKRYIHDKALSKAVEEGYEGFLMQHQYPFFILFLDFPDGAVDVNFHPKKEEVRFERKNEICDVLSESVHNRLTLREDIDVVPINEIVKTDISEYKDIDDQGEDDEYKVDFSEPEGSVYTEPNKSYVAENNVSVYNSSVKKPAFQGFEPFESKKNEESDLPPDLDDEIPVKYEQRSFLTEESRPYFNIIGQVFDTYWIIEYKGKMFIIDQHAAHEKVNYERLVKKVYEQSVVSQILSPPVIITLNEEEQTNLKEHLDDFEALGFKLSPFGGNDFALSEVPYEMESVDKKQLFLDIIEEAGKWKKLSDTRLVRERLATMACKASIKGNQRVSRGEIEELISELLTLDNPYHCPHGRPTMISFDRNDLDKMFKRIV